MLASAALLKSPDQVSTYYATNFSTNSAQLKTPERLKHGDIYDEEPPSTMKVTLQYTFVDLRIDHGKHGIAALLGECTKIRTLYPPTPSNINAYQEKCAMDCIFQNISVTTEQDYLYLPPGCIHATYTLAGGLTPGIEYTTVCCLDIPAQVLDKDGCQPILEAVSLELRSNHVERTYGMLCSSFSIKKHVSTVSRLG